MCPAHVVSIFSSQLLCLSCLWTPRPPDWKLHWSNIGLLECFSTTCDSQPRSDLTRLKRGRRLLMGDGSGGPKAPEDPMVGHAAVKRQLRVMQSEKPTLGQLLLLLCLSPVQVQSRCSRQHESRANGFLGPSSPLLVAPCLCS